MMSILLGTGARGVSVSKRLSDYLQHVKCFKLVDYNGKVACGEADKKRFRAPKKLQNTSLSVNISSKQHRPH